MKTALAICMLTIQSMASLKFDVTRHDGKVVSIDIPQKEVSAGEILREIYPDEHNDVIYQLRYRGTVLPRPTRFTMSAHGKYQPIKVDVVFNKEHFWEFEFKLPNGATVYMDIYNPKSKRIPVATLLTKLQYDPSRYQFYQNGTTKGLNEHIEHTDDCKFGIERIMPKSNGAEYSVIVARAGRENVCVDVKSEGTAADLLEVLKIYEPEKYKLEFQGEIIQSDDMLSDYGVGAEATVDVTCLFGANAISASIYARSVREKDESSKTPYDLMELECDAENHEIWMNGRKLKRVRYDGSRIEYMRIENEEEDTLIVDQYKIARIIGKHLLSQDNDEMKQCLNQFINR